MSRSTVIKNAVKYNQLGDSRGQDQKLQIPRMINHLCNLVGNDIVLKGLDVDINYDDSNDVLNISISSGYFIQDSTLIYVPTDYTLQLDDVSQYDQDGKIIVYIRYRYLQFNDPIKFCVSYVDQNGHVFDGWDSNKDRIILEYYDFAKSNGLITDITPSNDLYISIFNHSYYKYGYHDDNLTLVRYLNYFAKQFQSEATQFLPDDTIVQGDLTVNDSLTVARDLHHSGTNAIFDGTVVISDGLNTTGDVNTTGDNFFINSPNTETQSKYLMLNRNEEHHGIYNESTSGIQVKRGTLPDAFLYFDESDDQWKVKIDGSPPINIIGSGGSAPTNISYTDIVDWDEGFNTAFDSNLSAITTDDIHEGDVNKFLNNATMLSMLTSLLIPGIGIDISVNNDHLVISSDGGSGTGGYGIASSTDLGLIRIGDRVNITQDGILSADQQTEENFTSAEKLKLSNIEAEANNYYHPATHPADIIVQDSEHRFVTDTQINKWDSQMSEYLSIKEFNISPTIAEVGTTINNVELSWETTITPDAISLDNNIGSLLPDQINYQYSGSINTTSTFTLTVSNANTIHTATATLNFVSPIYIGASIQPSELNSTFILTNLQKIITGDIFNSYHVSAASDEYIWIVYPNGFGSIDISVGGISGGFVDLDIINLTNEYGHTRQYRVFASNQTGLGNTTFKLSVE